MTELCLSGISPAEVELCERLQRQSGVRVADCCQCGKCSAACPFAPYMDIMPRQVVRYMQLLQPQAILKARSPWICVACHACSCRCPKEIDLPALMEGLRQEAKRCGRIAVKEADIFTDLFIRTVRAFGRSHEMLLMGLFNMRSLRFLQDIHYAPAMYLKGKIHLLPRRAKDRTAIRRLIDPYIGKREQGGDRA